MPYDFTRFSTQSFERFVQALATSALGGRVQIFGAGPDGGREATYEGKCDINGTEWDGYVVVQAKYHSNAIDPDENADWLIKQIEGEFAKFEDKRRSLRLPDYYLLASNVRLSANAANARGKYDGGIDRVTKYLKETATRLGIKDTHLWHQDTLSTLIDVNDQVRTTFDFWVQPGDVLAALLRNIGKPNQEETLLRYVLNGLRQSKDIKTRDAGQVTNQTLALNEVFIDLPVTVQFWKHLVDSSATSSDDHHTLHSEGAGGLITADFDTETVENSPRILASLVERAADRLDCCMSSPQENGPQPNRILVLGGPGQGKSTVGQFLAQLFRARLLRATNALQTPETRQTVDAILARALNEQIPTTGPLRYPFHVELPRFADALSRAQSEEKLLTVVGYISTLVSKDADDEVTRPIIRSWMARIPSLVIFDGLDEISHSGNRTSVIAEIEVFLVKSLT